MTAELTGKITDYLAEMAAAGVMTEQQAARAAELQYVLIDIDRISELTKNVAVSMQTEKLVKKDKKSAKRSSHKKHQRIYRRAWNLSVKCTTWS